MKKAIKKILVSGGAGYVGSTLVPLLLNNNYQVAVIDNLSFGGQSLLNAWHHPCFKFMKVDITSFKDLEQAFESEAFDAVIHLAAIVGDPACSKLPDRAQATNWNGSLNMLDLSIKHKIKRFIFASTCSNYGKMPDPDGYVDETSALSPVSLYAELKVRFENVLLRELARKEEFSPVCLRFATVYGASPRMRFDLTVNEFTKELALGRQLEVFGERFWRPYCHVYDIARAIMLVLSRDKESVAYNVFNVGDSGENYQKKLIVDEIKKFIPDVSVKYVNKNEDPRDYKVSFEKIKKELGFKVSKKLPDGIEELIRLIKNKVIEDPDQAVYKN